MPSPHRRLVPRARPTDQLRVDGGAGARLILGAAPAGFGKTTLWRGGWRRPSGRSAEWRGSSRPGRRRPSPVPDSPRGRDPDRRTEAGDDALALFAAGRATQPTTLPGGQGMILLAQRSGLLDARIRPALLQRGYGPALGDTGEPAPRVPHPIEAGCRTARPRDTARNASLIAVATCSTVMISISGSTICSNSGGLLCEAEVAPIEVSTAAASPECSYRRSV
jgi:hypothetical protein